MAGLRSSISQDSIRCPCLGAGWASHGRAPTSQKQPGPHITGGPMGSETGSDLPRLTAH